MPKDFQIFFKLALWASGSWATLQAAQYRPTGQRLASSSEPTWSSVDEPASWLGLTSSPGAMLPRRRSSLQQVPPWVATRKSFAEEGRWLHNPHCFFDAPQGDCPGKPSTKKGHAMVCDRERLVAATYDLIGQNTGNAHLLKALYCAIALAQEEGSTRIEDYITFERRATNHLLTRSERTRLKAGLIGEEASTRRAGSDSLGAEKKQSPLRPKAKGSSSPQAAPHSLEASGAYLDTLPLSALLSGLEHLYGEMVGSKRYSLLHKRFTSFDDCAREIFARIKHGLPVIGAFLAGPAMSDQEEKWQVMNIIGMSYQEHGDHVSKIDAFFVLNTWPVEATGGRTSTTLLGELTYAKMQGMMWRAGVYELIVFGQKGPSELEDKVSNIQVDMILENVPRFESQPSQGDEDHVCALTPWEEERVVLQKEEQKRIAMQAGIQAQQRELCCGLL